MATKTIPQLTVNSSLDGTELFEISQSGSSAKVTLDSVRDVIYFLKTTNTQLTLVESGLNIDATGDVTLDLINDGDLILNCGTDKTLKLQDTVWDDLRTPANSSKKVPGKEAKDETYKSGLIIKFEKADDQAVAFNVQLSHNYKLGTDIEFHIHIVTPVAGSGSGAENVKFDFTYSWADIGDAFPDATTVIAIRDVQNDGADDHILMEIADSIDGSGISGVSSMLICSLTRDVSVANNYDENIYLIEVDFHYQIDTIGSRTEMTK